MSTTSVPSRIRMSQISAPKILAINYVVDVYQIIFYQFGYSHWFSMSFHQVPKIESMFLIPLNFTGLVLCVSLKAPTVPLARQLCASQLCGSQLLLHFNGRQLVPSHLYYIAVSLRRSSSAQISEFSDSIVAMRNSWKGHGIETVRPRVYCTDIVSTFITTGIAKASRYTFFFI